MCDRFEVADTRFRIPDNTSYIKWTPSTAIPTEIVPKILSKFAFPSLGSIKAKPTTNGIRVSRNLVTDDTSFTRPQDAKYVMRTHAECEEMLSAAPEGSFLVSPSETKIGSFRLSVAINTNKMRIVKHWPIVSVFGRGQLEMYYLENGKEFKTLDLLIEYYITSKNKTFKLTQPYRTVEESIALRENVHF